MNLDRLTRFALRRLGNWHDAETAAQYALVYGWKHPNASSAKCAVRGVNRVRCDRVRAAKRTAWQRGSAKPVAYRHRGVAYLVADLPEHLARTAVLLSQGYSQADVARVLGVSREAVSQRCDKLRVALA